MNSSHEMPKRQVILIPMIAVFITGCASDGANHMGNPVILPVRAVISGAQNLTYNQRRKRVSTYIRHHHAELGQEVIMGQGPLLNELIQLLPIAPEKQADFRSEIASNWNLYFSDDPEPLVVAAMVHR